MTIQLYTQKPVEVEAVQFDGWQSVNFEQLFRWLTDAGVHPFYVPQGYEHPLRTENEKDRSRGDTLTGAPPYLVIDFAEKARMRIDRGQWIVKDINGNIQVHSHNKFVKDYDRSLNNGV